MCSLASNCPFCRHIREREAGMLWCAAFPQGIPERILGGEIDHTRPYPGDHGFRFDPDPASLADWLAIRSLTAGIG